MLDTTGSANLDCGEVKGAAESKNLTPSQTAALAVMAAGGSFAEAATAAGVDRGTLYRWRTGDQRFIDALIDWRSVAHDHCHDRMLALSGKAMDALAAGLEKGDARLAFRLMLDLRKMQHDASRRQRHAAPAPFFSQSAGATVGDPPMTPEQALRVLDRIDESVELENEYLKTIKKTFDPAKAETPPEVAEESPAVAEQCVPVKDTPAQSATSQIERARVETAPVETGLVETGQTATSSTITEETTSLPALQPVSQSSSGQDAGDQDAQSQGPQVQGAEGLGAGEPTSGGQGSTTPPASAVIEQKPTRPATGRSRWPEDMNQWSVGMITEREAMYAAGIDPDAEPEPESAP